MIFYFVRKYLFYERKIIFFYNSISMNFDTSWDVDKYKSDHECDEHWNFKRTFMIAHKNKFPEQRLVCLTQAYFCIEYLGCK